MTADLAMMPAWQLVKLYKSRKASPVEATKAAIARIEAFNPQLNAFQHLDPDAALRAASGSRCWKALSCGLNASMRAIAALVASTGEALRDL